MHFASQQIVNCPEHFSVICPAHNVVPDSATTYVLDLSLIVWLQNGAKQMFIFRMLRNIQNETLVNTKRLEKRYRNVWKITRLLPKYFASDKNVAGVIRIFISVIIYSL